MEPGIVFQPNKPNVVHEVIDGEAVIVDLNTGTYFSTEKVGALVWTLIDKEFPVERIIEEIQKRYTTHEADIPQSIRQLISRFQEENLIVPKASAGSSNEDGHGSPEAPEDESKDAKIPFEEPKLEKYSDMEDLLLLDPIHDVEEEGWPKANVTQKVD